MAGRIKFKVNKYVHGSRSKDVFEFKPKAQIIFEGKRIGQIIDTEVYFYISVKDRTLNYIPELWGKFSTHQEAKEAVITQAEYIWKTLNIYHPLKTLAPNYGLWEKIFGVTLLGWMNILIFQWLFIRISYNWVYVDPDKDEDARTDDFWDDEKQQFVAKTFYYYAIIGCIIPLTGWWGDYVMPFKFKGRLTKVKEYYE